MANADAPRPRRSLLAPAKGPLPLPLAATASAGNESSVAPAAASLRGGACPAVAMWATGAAGLGAPHHTEVAMETGTSVSGSGVPTSRPLQCGLSWQSDAIIRKKRRSPCPLSAISLRMYAHCELLTNLPTDRCAIVSSTWIRIYQRVRTHTTLSIE